jgi:CRISPR-associated protein Cmr1
MEKKEGGTIMALDKHTIQIKTLTPLWTGDAEGECNEVKETGIIGSLRWWYEALVRGLGGYACDPTDSDCKFDYKEFRKTGKIQDGLKDVCNVCRLFGCTGWSRRFQISIRNGKPPYKGTLRVSWDKNRNKGWYLGSGLYGTLYCDIVSPSEEYYQSVISLLEFLSQWGGIGAKTQQGYGAFLVENTKYGLSKIKLPETLVKEKRKRNFEQRHLSNIEDIFFCKIHSTDFLVESIPKTARFEFLEEGQKRPTASEKNENNGSRTQLENIGEEYGFFPISPLLRYHVRRLFNNNKDLRHFVMGFMSISGRHKLRIGKRIHEKMGSKMHISHLFKIKDGFEVKIWIWIPQFIEVGNAEITPFEEHFKAERNDILKTVDGGIKDVCTNILSMKDLTVSWWKFDSGTKRMEKTDFGESLVKEAGDYG